LEPTLSWNQLHSSSERADVKRIESTRNLSVKACFLVEPLFTSSLCRGSSIPQNASGYLSWIRFSCSPIGYRRFVYPGVLGNLRRGGKHSAVMTIMGLLHDSREGGRILCFNLIGDVAQDLQAAGNRTHPYTIHCSSISPLGHVIENWDCHP